MIGEDHVRRVAVELPEEVVTRLDAGRLEGHAAGAQFMADEQHVRRNVFEDEDSKFLVHEVKMQEVVAAVPAGVPDWARCTGVT